jgi:hypothetical protein
MLDWSILVALLLSQRPDVEVTVLDCGWPAVGATVGCVTANAGVAVGLGVTVGLGVAEAPGTGLSDGAVTMTTGAGFLGSTKKAPPPTSARNTIPPMIANSSLRPEEATEAGGTTAIGFNGISLSRLSTGALKLPSAVHAIRSPSCLIGSALGGGGTYSVGWATAPGGGKNFDSISNHYTA